MTDEGLLATESAPSGTAEPTPAGLADRLASVRFVAPMAHRLVRSSFARSAGATFTLKVGEALASIVISLLLARMLGAAEFGTYSYAMAWVALLAIPGLFGMENLTVRHVSAYGSRAAWGLLRGYLARAFQTVGAFSAALALLVGLGTAVVAGSLDTGLASFGLAMLIVPALSLLRLSQAALRGLRHVALGYFGELGVMPVIVIVLIGVAFLTTGPGFGATGALTIQLTATVAGLAVTAALLWRRLPGQLGAAPAVFETRGWYASALPLLFIAAAQAVNRQADIIMLGVLQGPTAAGIYTIATRGAGLINFVLFAVNAALAPRIASLYAAGDLAGIQRLATRSSRLIFLFSLPGVLAFVFFGGWFMGLFGEEFLVGATALAILSVAQLINAAAGSVGVCLTMTGHERDAARGFAAAAVVNVALNALLIPALGLVGAALSTGTSLVAWNVLLVRRLEVRLGVDSTVLGRVVHRPVRP